MASRAGQERDSGERGTNGASRMFSTLWKAVSEGPHARSTHNRLLRHQGGSSGHRTPGTHLGRLRPKSLAPTLLGWEENTAGNTEMTNHWPHGSSSFCEASGVLSEKAQSCSQPQKRENKTTAAAAKACLLCARHEAKYFSYSMSRNL